MEVLLPEKRDVDAPTLLSALPSAGLHRENARSARGRNERKAEEQDEFRHVEQGLWERPVQG